MGIAEVVLKNPLEEAVASIVVLVMVEPFDGNGTDELAET